MKPKLVFTHPYFAAHTRELTRGQVRTVVASTPAQLRRELRDADGLMIHFAQKADARFLVQAPRL